MKQISESGRGLPHSKSFANSYVRNRAARFWSAAVLCRFGSSILSSAFALILPCFGVTAAPAAETLDFKEVFELLRTNLPGVTEAELNQAAARGLISQFRPKVTLVTEATKTNAASAAAQTTRASVFDRSFGYIRLGQLARGSDDKFFGLLKDLNTNRLKGLVIDLRFSDGTDYEAAAAIADRFFATEQPLVDYGDGLKKSTVKQNAITIPIAILVNNKTAGAAEALAGILRQNEAGLLIGANSAGQASINKDVTLSTGQTLRIAVTPVKTGNGNPLPAAGLKPDISVDVNPEDELAYLEDAYKDLSRPSGPAAATNETLAAASTNRGPRRRITEADLVRRLRDGIPFDDETSTNRPAGDPVPVVQDPALARALDLVKGLAVVQQSRSL